MEGQIHGLQRTRKECEIIRAENADLIQIFKSELEKPLFRFGRGHRSRPAASSIPRYPEGPALIPRTYLSLSYRWLRPNVSIGNFWNFGTCKFQFTGFDRGTNLEFISSKSLSTPFPGICSLIPESKIVHSS